MKPVRLPAAATHALPRWMLFALCLLYILPGLIGRDPWKTEDAAGFGIMWTMAHGGLQDWLLPHIVGLPMVEKGPLAYWLGAICIKLFGSFIGDPLAARISTVIFFIIGSSAVWYSTYLMGRRVEAQPLKLAFGGQPEVKDYGRTLSDGALLIYLGSLGLLLHSHTTSTEALLVSLIALAIYQTARLFDDKHSPWAGVLLGITLGLQVLTRGWVVPLALWLAIFMLAALRERTLLLKITLVTLPVAVIIGAIWPAACYLVQPFHSSPYDAWMLWNYHQLGLPSFDALRYVFKSALWFSWPAWPFAAWALYAWRQQQALHIDLPVVFFAALFTLSILSPHQDEGILLPFLPPLAILAAFGLPTMKRGAINAVDWFSVMMLTLCAGFIWIGWIAKQTGWPAQLAKNAFKLAPGFKPEFNLLACVVAALATAGWIVLVHWRISRKPFVLWRAVVLSSGGVILCWLLLTTLWLPWINYGKSYAGVAKQIEEKLPSGRYCVDSNVGPAQRASFAYFGKIPFSQFDDSRCNFLILQDRDRKKPSDKIISRDNDQWRLLWEGRRPTDRDERYRLYQRIKR